jgi:DNA-binding transcriptional regulator YhcF (GntR family)
VKIDPNDPRPPFRQAADDLRKRISAGEFAPGERLPSIRRLADEYEISPQTVQNALRELRQANLVVAQQGRAFYVRDPSRPQATGTDADRLAEAETEIRDLKDRVTALEADNAGLRALITELYSRIGQP